ncbi:MAG: SET domain-containing protein [Planctomycetes bacterium]|nr:SET domain-containing protein [Planctomycetota bacterium]
MRHSELIQVKRVKGKGRGVFARCDIARGSVIEVAPVMLVPVATIVDGLHNPDLARFYFMWNDKYVAMVLGYGSLYNHSYQPNARYEDGRGKTLLFRSIRKIKAGDEITINYNGRPGDRRPVGFEVK